MTGASACCRRVELCVLVPGDHAGPFPVLFPHLFVEQAECHIEEKALQAVEQGKDVGQPCAMGVEEEQAEAPGAAQHEELSNGRDGQHSRLP